MLQFLDPVVAGQLQEFVVGIVEHVAGMDQHRHRQLLEDRGVHRPRSACATPSAKADGR